MTTTVEHGFNLDAIRRELDKEDWESDPENPGTQVRRIFLGDVFSLTPSGKMYTPFACSNVDPCPTCKGTGIVLPRRLKRRVEKRHAARHARIKRIIIRRFGGRDGYTVDIQPASLRAKAEAFARRVGYSSVCYRNGTTCTACAGCGSREAHLDELWQEAAEEGIAETPKGDEGDGVFLSWEDGDAFAVETRDEPEDDGDDEGDDETGDVDTEATEGDVGF
jgi:hypothetical protein